MQEKEQKQFDKDAQKKALIGNGIILSVLVIGIILAVFAWFGSIRNNSTASGFAFTSVDNLDIRFNTYPGEMQSNGTVVYDMSTSMDLNNDDFDEVTHKFNMFPGEKRYFRTDISNYMLNSYTGSFVLQDILVNSKLVSTSEKVCILFFSDMGSNTQQQVFDLSRAYDYIVDNVVSPDIKKVPSQNIRTGVFLPAGNNNNGGNVSPGVVSVYWYIVLDGNSVGNDVMGEQVLQFKSIRFIPTA